MSNTTTKEYKKLNTKIAEKTYTVNQMQSKDICVQSNHRRQAAACRFTSNASPPIDDIITVPPEVTSYLAILSLHDIVSSLSPCRTPSQVWIVLLVRTGIVPSPDSILVRSCPRAFRFGCRSPWSNKGACLGLPQHNRFDPHSIDLKNVTYPQHQPRGVRRSLRLRRVTCWYTDETECCLLAGSRVGCTIWIWISHAPRVCHYRETVHIKLWCQLRGLSNNWKEVHGLSPNSSNPSFIISRWIKTASDRFYTHDHVRLINYPHLKIYPKIVFYICSWWEWFITFQSKTFGCNCEIKVRRETETSCLAFTSCLITFLRE